MIDGDTREGLFRVEGASPGIGRCAATGLSYIGNLLKSPHPRHKGKARQVAFCYIRVQGFFFSIQSLFSHYTEPC